MKQDALCPWSAHGRKAPGRGLHSSSRSIDNRHFQSSHLSSCGSYRDASVGDIGFKLPGRTESMASVNAPHAGNCLARQIAYSFSFDFAGAVSRF